MNNYYLKKNNDITKYRYDNISEMCRDIFTGSTVIKHIHNGYYTIYNNGKIYTVVKNRNGFNNAVKQLLKYNKEVAI